MKKGKAASHQGRLATVLGESLAEEGALPEEEDRKVTARSWRRERQWKHSKNGHALSDRFAAARCSRNGGLRSALACTHLQ